MSDYALPELDYDYAALEPAISGEIMELHHGEHHAAYVKGANDTLENLAAARDAGDFGAIVGLEKTLALNLAGRAMHTVFWKNLTPPSSAAADPDGELAAAVEEFFGSADNLRARPVCCRPRRAHPGGHVSIARRGPRHDDEAPRSLLDLDAHRSGPGARQPPERPPRCAETRDSVC